MDKEEKCKELLEKIKQTPDNIIEEAIDSLSKKINKEGIEEAKQCLDVTIQTTYAEGKAIKLDNLKKYIQELEQKESILDKVIEFATKIVTENAEKYNSENQKEADFSEWNLALEILNIIEGEKK